MNGFLSRQRLIHGPWSAFERAVVRLCLHTGHPEVHYTGGPGDKGCDIFVVTKEKEKLVIQCKFTITDKPAGKGGVDDLRRACFEYDANRGLLCVNSRQLSPGAKEDLETLISMGFSMDLWKYHDFIRKSKEIPEYSEHRKKPRNYQDDAIDASVKSLLKSGRSLVEMATGLGKTIVMAEVIDRILLEEPNWRVLILADKKAIVSQVERAIWSQLPKSVITHILSGTEKPILDNGVTIATFESLISDYKNGRDLPEYNLVLVDECHHAHAESYAEIIDVVARNSMLMGVTATPWRGDEKDITEIFGKPVYQMGIVEGISLGWLADIDYEMYCDNVDWNKVSKLSKEGHTIKNLNSNLFLPARDEELIEKVLSRWTEMGQPKIITFCKSKKHAKEMCELFNEMGLPTRYLTGDHNEKERAVTFTDFSLGKFSNLIGVDILNEGVDLPDVELVVFARVTHSRRIFVQQLGRGLRVTDDKDRVTIMDFVADVRRLGALAKLNRSARNEEYYRDSGADLVEFNQKVKTYFVEEYLADVADLEENHKPKLDFLLPDGDPD